MIEGRTIVCIASSWDYDPTSKHQIMNLLAQRNHIVWVNYHGTRRPILSSADVKAGLGVLKRIVRGVQPVGPTFNQVTPLVFPGARNRVLQRLHEHLLVSQIRRAIKRTVGQTAQPIQIWAFAPDVPFLIGRFNEEAFIYYCVDDYTLFEGYDSKRIQASEDEMVRRADLVVTTSEALLQCKSRLRKDAELVRHGVDYDRFASAWKQELPRPKDLASIAGPIFGFFGLIQFWIDTSLLELVAKLRPKYSFVFIGDCSIDVSHLACLPNVHFLGRKKNHELPAYCRAFDAGLMPFTQTAMTDSVNPIKMYEYLAAGLPVVSTPLPEARRFSDVIELTDTPEAFAKACDTVLAKDYAGRREDISHMVKGESWRSKVETLSQLVMRKDEPNQLPVSKAVAEVMGIESGVSVPTKTVG